MVSYSYEMSERVFFDNLSIELQKASIALQPKP